MVTKHAVVIGYLYRVNYRIDKSIHGWTLARIRSGSPNNDSPKNATQPDSSNRSFTFGMTGAPVFSPYMGWIWEVPDAFAMSDQSTLAHPTPQISSPRANHRLSVKHSRTVHNPLPVSSPPLFVLSPPVPDPLCHVQCRLRNQRGIQ